KLDSSSQKINQLKDTIKKIFFISKKEFDKLVIKAGGGDTENWKRLYRAIACRDEIALERLTGELQTSIGKLDSIFDTLRSGESINNDTTALFKMSAA